MEGSLKWIHFAVCCFLLQRVNLVEAIQCYSCKAQGSNEVDANIRCLEEAYLENCDDFYDYYSQVEDQDVLSYEYYYYEKEAEESENKAENPSSKTATSPAGNKRKTQQVKKSHREKRQLRRPSSYSSSDENQRLPASRSESDEFRRQDRQQQQELFSRQSGPRFADSEEESRLSRRERLLDPDYDVRQEAAREESRRNFRDFDFREEEDIYSRPLEKHEESLGHGKEEEEAKKNKDDEQSKDALHDDDREDVRDVNEKKSSVEYEYYDDYEYIEYELPPAESPSSVSTTTSLTTTVLDRKAVSKVKPTQPKDPEHHCYSATKKEGWESYTVEKGCKKIRFCKDHVENLPDWSNPWNFCCDKSRCNAKQVKDKPQRIFGMNCRRHDDCIQGHNNRPVCPSHFKSCPRISTSMIKMECRVKDRSLTSGKNTARYQSAFREKKCYCRKGYFPKGPICTSASGSRNLFRVESIVISTLCVAFRRTQLL